MRAHKLQVGIIAGVTAASALAAAAAVLPLPMWDYLGALADYPARRMPTPALFGWTFLVGLAAGVPLGLLVWKLPLPVRWRPVRDIAALLVGTGMAVIPVGFVLVPNALGGVLMAVPGLAMAVAVLYQVQRCRRIPLHYCLVAVMWGGTFAITVGHQLLPILHLGVAYWLRRPDVAMGPDLALPAPLWEELVKGLGVLAVFAHLRRRYDSPVHGFVLGAMVGAGFNFVETSRYAMYNFDAAILQVWVRQWVSGIAFGHVLFTGLVGVAIALACRQRRAIVGLAIAAAGLGLAIAAHFVWNWTASTSRQPVAFDDAFLATLFGYPLNYLILSGPFLLLLVVTLVLADRREGADLCAGLLAELRTGRAVISPEEASILANPRLRRAHRLFSARARGWWAYPGVGYLQQQQLDLAYERFRLAQQVGRAQAASPRALRRHIQTLVMVTDALCGRDTERPPDPARASGLAAFAVADLAHRIFVNATDPRIVEFIRQVHQQTGADPQLLDAVLRSLLGAPLPSVNEPLAPLLVLGRSLVLALNLNEEAVTELVVRSERQLPDAQPNSAAAASNPAPATAVGPTPLPNPQSPTAVVRAVSPHSGPALAEPRPNTAPYVVGGLLAVFGVVALVAGLALALPRGPIRNGQDPPPTVTSAPPKSDPGQVAHAFAEAINNEQFERASGLLCAESSGMTRHVAQGELRVQEFTLSRVATQNSTTAYLLAKATIDPQSDPLVWRGTLRTRGGDWCVLDVHPEDDSPPAQPEIREMAFEKMRNFITLVNQSDSDKAMSYACGTRQWMVTQTMIDMAINTRAQLAVTPDPEPKDASKYTGSVTGRTQRLPVTQDVVGKMTISRDSRGIYCISYFEIRYE